MLADKGHIRSSPCVHVLRMAYQTKGNLTTWIVHY